LGGPNRGRPIFLIISLGFAELICAIAAFSGQGLGEKFVLLRIVTSGCGFFVATSPDVSCLWKEDAALEQHPISVRARALAQFVRLCIFALVLSMLFGLPFLFAMSSQFGIGTGLTVQWAIVKYGIGSVAVGVLISQGARTRTWLRVVTIAAVVAGVGAFVVLVSASSTARHVIVESLVNLRRRVAATNNIVADASTVMAEMSVLITICASAVISIQHYGTRVRFSEFRTLGWIRLVRQSWQPTALLTLAHIRSGELVGFAAATAFLVVMLLGLLSDFHGGELGTAGVVVVMVPGLVRLRINHSTESKAAWILRSTACGVWEALRAGDQLVIAFVSAPLSVFIGVATVLSGGAPFVLCALKAAFVLVLSSLVVLGVGSARVCYPFSDPNTTVSTDPRQLGVLLGAGIFTFLISSIDLSAIEYSVSLVGAGSSLLMFRKLRLRHASLATLTDRFPIV